MSFTWFHRLGSPPYIYRLAQRLAPWFAWPAALLILAGLWGGLVLAPPDYQQGDGFRIIYVHAPSAWLSLMVYTSMAVAAAVGLIWRIKVAHAVAASWRQSAPPSPMAALVTARSGAGRCGEHTGSGIRGFTAELVYSFSIWDIWAYARHRRHAAGGSRQCRAGGRRRGERAHHSLLGHLVELAAPGAFGHAAGEADVGPPRCW